MAVHMVRVYAEHPNNTTVAEVDAAVQNWVAAHTEWAADAVTHEMQATTTADDATAYLRGDFRFTIDDDRVTLLDDAEAALQPEVAWYRLGVHTCSHDEAGGVDCAWEDQREWTAKPNITIPAGVPTFI